MMRILRGNREERAVLLKRWAAVSQREVRSSRVRRKLSRRLPMAIAHRRGVILLVLGERMAA